MSVKVYMAGKAFISSGKRAMTVTEICPNPNCRARLQVQLPAPTRIHCPRCHAPITVQPVSGSPGVPESLVSPAHRPVLSGSLASKGRAMPSWMLAVCLLLFFVSGACGLVILVNCWHWSQIKLRHQGQPRVLPFQWNIRFSPPTAGFVSKTVRPGAGWIQDWSKAGGARLLIGGEDLQGQQPEVEDLEAMTLSRLDDLFPENRFQVALKKEERPARVAGEPCAVHWSLEIAESDHEPGNGEKREVTGKLFGSVAVVTRRGYLYWFVGLEANPVLEPLEAWWTRVEWGTERENWIPVPLRELKVPVADKVLTLDPEVWRILEGEEKLSLLKSFEGDPKPGKAIGGFQIETVLQGRKKRSASQDSALKSNALLMAVSVGKTLDKQENWVGEWERWRLHESAQADEPPVIKLVPMTGQNGLYRSTVNGETDELILVAPLPGGKSAWIAACPFTDRASWSGEFARVRRSLGR